MKTQLTKYTTGDETQAPCPSCGMQMSLQDITTDGCLKPGFVDRCEHCGAEFEIEDVEYSATVWVKSVVVQQPETEGSSEDAK